MKTNFSMLYYMKKQKNYQSGLVPIYLRITVNGQQAELTTGRECDPIKWNNKSGRAVGTKEDIKSFNASCIIYRPGFMKPIVISPKMTS